VVSSVQLGAGSHTAVLVLPFRLMQWVIRCAELIGARHRVGRVNAFMK